jgi:hypothetical protein
MYAGVFMQIDSKDGTGHTYLCTCDADVNAKQLHGGVSFVDYLAGHVFESITIEGSADISGGNGFFAAPAGGEIVIADGDGALAVSLLDGSWGLIGGRIYIAHRTQDGVMHKLYQLLVTEAGINDDGSISITCKMPSAEANAMMHKSAAVTQLLTGPDDPANPTDPDYRLASSANLIAGTALGGVAVSLKSGNPIPACKLARWDTTDLRTGDVTTDGGVAYVSSVFGSFSMAQTEANDTATRHGASISFRCRAEWISGVVDTSQAEQLKADLDAFVAAGYKIVLSDGNWFCDIQAESKWPGDVNLYNTTSINSPNVWYDVFNLGVTAPDTFVGVWFNMTNSDFESLLKEDVDPTAVSIYAIPKAVPISSTQVVLDGFARNKKTVKSNGEDSVEGGVQLFSPLVSTESSIITASPIRDFGLTFEKSTVAALDRLGGIENALADGDVNLTGAGNIEDIKTDPSARWDGGASPVWFKAETKSSALERIWARIKCAPSILSVDADFIVIENTWKATYTAAPGFTRSSVLAATGPLELSPTTGIWHTFAPSEVYTKTRQASIAPKNPRWTRAFTSLSDCRNNLTPMVESSGRLPHMQSIRLDVMECFAFAYSKFGFQSIYSTVYPFWTRKNCGNLAYGAGTLVAGGAGRGTQIQPNGEITWEPFDLPVPFGSTAVVTGTAYGVLDSTWWVSVGYTQAGSVQTPACWLSNDGLTWTQDGGYQTSALPTSVKFLNGAFLVTRTDGILDFANSESVFFTRLDWSAINTGATGPLNDIAFGVGTYIVVGNGGQARYSTNLSSWIAWNWSGGDDLLCVCYSQSGIGGYFHVGVNSGLVGTVFRKYDGSDTWTVFPLPLGDKVTAIMDSDGDVIAMNPGGVYARSPGLMDAAWKDRYSIGDNSGDVGGVAFSIDGANHLVVGANAQILTSPSFLQGSSFEAAYAGVPDWTPWGTKTPSMALDHLIVQKLGGTADNWNPVRFSRKSPLYSAFGVAFDPPSSTEGVASGTTALEALRKICKEWWCFAGDMPASKLDGSADAIEAMIPDVKMGNREDVYTQITAQYQPFGGEYLGRAYIQNVDKAYVAGNDALYFGGWDLPGANTFGLLLWQRCRDAYLATGILRETSLTFDSVQDAATLGALWVMEDQDLGERILWLCRQPRYYRVTVRGNESAAALANVGCRYKPNATLLTERGLDLGITGYGVVVESSHDPVGARHELLIAFPPEQPA